jgi:cytochrome c oxidase subunit 2
MPMSAESSVAGPGRRRRDELRHITWIWLGLTILLVLFSIWVPARLMGPPASPTMRAVESTMTVFSIAASPVAALVWAIAIYSLLRWKSRGEPTEDGPPFRSNGPVTASWAIVTSVLCVFLLIWGLAEMTSTTSAAEASNPLVVDVTGQQWVWTFSYPSQGGVESDQLYLPLNRPVVFHVSSKDVIHSFWVVQMGIKVDANPGVTTKTSVTPDRLGVFDIRCAELCGLRHADMEASAHVVNPADFAAWITQHGGHA